MGARVNAWMGRASPEGSGGVGGGGGGWARRRLRFGKQGMLMGFERQPLKVFKYFRRLVSKN